MNKNIIITILSLFPFLIPQLTYACGGSTFSIHHSMIYITFALFLLHSFVFYKLSKKTDLATKESVVKKYSRTLFQIHFLLPIIAYIILVLSRVAFACIDPRSPQERFIDGLSIPFQLAIIISLFVSAIFFMRVESKKLTVETKVKSGKIVAASLGVIALITFVYLSYAFWVIAPTLSDTPFAFDPTSLIPLSPIP